MTALYGPIRRLWHDGLDTAQIADRLGRPESEVYNALQMARSRQHVVHPKPPVEVVETPAPAAAPEPPPPPPPTSVAPPPEPPARPKMVPVPRKHGASLLPAKVVAQALTHRVVQERRGRPPAPAFQTPGVGRPVEKRKLENMLADAVRNTQRMNDAAKDGGS